MACKRFTASIRVKLSTESLKASLLRVTKIPTYDNNVYLQHTLKWLTLFGSWNTFSRSKFIYNVYTVLILSNQFILALSTVRYLVVNRNLSSNMQCVRISVFVTGIILKQLIMILKRKKISDMKEILKQTTNTTTNEYKYIEYVCELLGRHMAIYPQIVGLLTNFIILGPSLHGYWYGVPTELGYKVVYPFDQDRHKGFSQVLQISSGLAVTGSAVAIGSLQIHFMLHFTGQLHILALMLRDLHARVGRQYEDRQAIKVVDGSEGRYSPITQRDAKVSELSEGYITECIERHRKLFSLVNCFLDAFSPIFYVQMVTNVSAIGIIMYEISQGNRNSAEILNSVATLTLTLLEVAITCFLGSQIMYKSEEVAAAAYDTEWVSMSNKFKVMVKTIICRAQNPICLHGCHMYKIENETFYKICQVSISYMMFISDMVRREN